MYHIEFKGNLPISGTARPVESRRGVTFLCCSAWLVLLLLGSGPLAAQEGGAGEGTGVILEFPGLSSSAVEQTLEQRRNTLDEVQVSRSPVTASPFVDALRFQLIPARSEALRLTWAECRPGSGQFGRLLSRASEALDFYELESAKKLLTRAQRAFQCGPEAISREDLSRLLFLEGVLEVELGEEGDDAFLEAMTVKPGLKFPTDYSEGVQAAYRRALTRNTQRDRVAIKLEARDIQTSELRINGVRVTTSQLSLPAGTIYLQWVGQDGAALVGQSVELEGGSSSAPLVWPPPSLRPPSVQSVVERLKKVATSGQLSEELKPAVENTMSEFRHPWVLLVAPTSEPTVARAVWIFPGSMVGLEEVRLPQKSKSAFSRPSTWAAAGLGACALVAGGVYGHDFYQVSSTVYPTREDGLPIYQRGRTAGITSGLCLSGALISTGIGWLRHRNKNVAQRSNDLRLELVLDHHLGLLSLRGEW